MSMNEARYTIPIPILIFPLFLLINTKVIAKIKVDMMQSWINSSTPKIAIGPIYNEPWSTRLSPLYKQNPMISQPTTGALLPIEKYGSLSSPYANQWSFPLLLPGLRVLSSLHTKENKGEEGLREAERGGFKKLGSLQRKIQNFSLFLLLFHPSFSLLEFSLHKSQTLSLNMSSTLL